jgi:ABC-type Co2+ transport system permease subunit
MIGSVIIFAVGGLRYIDALFFASGGATQAGLNTCVGLLPIVATG